MNYQELEPFRNQQRALASIASQFLIAGYTLEDALKQADYMLIKSDEYLNDQAIEDHYDDENREYFRIQFTIKHVQKELKLSSTTMIYRHLSKFLDEKGIALIKSKARRQEVAFSQDYIDRIISLTKAGITKRSKIGGLARKQKYLSNKS